MEANNLKPPVGVVPRKLWEEERFLNVSSAIQRRHHYGFEIPVEWVEEYNDYIKKREVKYKDENNGTTTL